MTVKRKVVISGVSSFVGCHLAKAFAVDWDVTAVTSRQIEQYDGIRAKRLGYIEDDVNFQTCDLTNAKAIEKLVEEIRPQLWIQHGGFAENYASPDYDLAKSLDVNVLALKPLYKALAKIGACIILTGSNAEYGPAKDTADREDDACWPDTPYGLSKLAETIEARRLAQIYPVRTRVARLFIPVGELDAPGKLMDHVITNLKSNQIVDLSPCLQKRDFLSVNDIAEAYLKVAEDMHRCSFDIFNICSGEARELKSLLLDICQLVDKSADLMNFGAFPMRAGEPMSSFGDNSKARKILNWEPSSLEGTLKALINE
jgi:nucleoside-diphosphate-sugar epimerase